MPQVERSRRLQLLEAAEAAALDADCDHQLGGEDKQGPSCARFALACYRYSSCWWVLVLLVLLLLIRSLRVTISHNPCTTFTIT